MSAGRALIEAKQQLRHGQWLPWLAEHKIKDRTAQAAMQLAGMTPQEVGAFAAKNAEDCQRYRETGSKSAGQPAHLVPVRPPPEAPRPRRQTSVTTPDQLRAIRFIKSASPDQLRAVLTR